MSDLEEQLGRILNDPEQMARINALAQSLMGGEAPAAEAPVSGGDASLPGKLLGLLNRQEEDGGKRALLEAMKPYLSEKRRGRLDRAMKLTRMAKLARLAMGELGNGETL